MTEASQRSWQEISWKDGIPYSPQFDDIYYSREGGIEETYEVFIRANDLEQRFSSSPQSTICELGFGTGQNFFCSREALLEHGSDDNRLLYISIDRYPLSREDFLACADERFKDAAEAIAAQYPCAPYGTHRLTLDNGRITLILIYEEVQEALRNMDGSVHAWFLDGFTPTRNPKMWEQEVFVEMNRLSHCAATLGTFSSAGHVKRGLREAGFLVSRKTREGKKKHYVVGKNGAGPKPHNVSEPWYQRPPSRPVGKAAVIGAGLAGSASARELSNRGWQVTVIDQAPQAAAGASGNPWGLLMPMLTKKPAPQSQLSLAAWMSALRRLSDAGPDMIRRCGVIELAHDEVPADELAEQLSRYNLPAEVANQHSAEELSQIAGIDVTRHGLHFPMAACVSPRQLCEANLTGIDQRYNSRVLSLEQASSGWQINCEDGGSIEADVVVIANAGDYERFSQLDWLPMRHIRGQLSRVPERPASTALSTALVYTGYILPAFDGEHVIGATYDVHSRELDWRDADHQRLIEDCGKALPTLAGDCEGWKAESTGRAAVRSMTPDQLPAIGPVPDRTAFEQDYADLHYGRHWQEYPPGTYLPGLYVSLGHGSRGIMTSQFGAELLAAQISGEAWPHRKLEKLLHPSRYLIRALRREHV